MTVLLGIDGGFAAMGYAVASWDNDHLDVLEMGLLETKKSARKVPVSEDNDRRARLLCRKLLNIVFGHEIDGICSESMSFPPSSSASCKLCLSRGVVDAVAEIHLISTVQKSPQDIKMAAAGSRTASKGQIRAALSMHYPSSMEAFEKAGVTASKAEHCWDALGAIVACLDTDIVRALVKR